ncbi:glycosyltransferase family 9 protein [Roseateles chitosanitabidus]|uniref:glycosyltransferase family 9 protein n=1 Tax=Roseateles chitosanitabidus TaxID=65048 RepID=UPI00082CB2C0|nr:glycosyltransferase family 9 protein [Roseateles chitosanitabidus]MBO9687805.1 glycosyl transferase [Roseateles chitosanitabidus]
MISTSLDTLRRLPDSTAARHDVDPGEDSARIDRGTEREAGVGHEVGREAGGEDDAPTAREAAVRLRHRRWCNVRRVLLVRLDGVAGVLASTAAFAALHETMPWAQLTLLASPEGLAMRPHLEGIDDVLPFNASWTADGAAMLAAEPPTMRGDAEMHLVRKLRRSHFDAAILFTSAASSALPAALLCRMAGIPLVLAHEREPAHGLLSDTHAETLAPHDDTRRQLALVAHIGMRTDDERPRFRLQARDSQLARQSLGAAGLRLGQRYVLVCPGGGGERACPPAAFGAAADVLLDSWADDTVAVFCARPGEEGELTAARAAMHARGQVLPTAPGLGELAALAAGARVMVAADDLPLTLAAAAGVPAVLPGEALLRERAASST